MGKLQLDPMFRNLSNRVGNFVHVKWKGMQVIRAYNPHRTASSKKQQEVQTAFKGAVALWKQMHPLMKKSWKAYTSGKPMTEYNGFISQNVSLRKEGRPALFTQEVDLKSPENYTAASNSKGKITIDCSSVPNDLFVSIILQKIIDGNAVLELDTRYDVSRGGQSVTLSGLDSGHEYFVYSFVTDSPIDEAEKISRSVAAKLKVM